MNAPLTGPTHIPENPTHALVCLHGFGDEGASYLGLHAPLQANLPNISLGIWAPNGPQRVPQYDSGYQWFSDKSWTFRDRDGIEAASQALWQYIQKNIVQAHHIPLKNIAVLGFSQGAMTALYAAPRWPEQVGAVISHSGIAMWQEYLNKKTCQKPPVLFLHGQDDDTIPADQSVHAAQGLTQLGFETETHLIPNLSHGLNAQSLAHISVFLTGHFR